MKLLIVHNRYRYSGGEDQVVRRESELLRSAGHSVLEYTRRNDEILEDGILNKAKLGMQTLWAWDTQQELQTILRRERPQVVHFHNTFPLISPAAYYTCQAAGVPVVQSLHNPRLMCPTATFYREGKVCQDCLGKAVPWPGVVHSCYHNSALHTLTVAGMLSLHRLLGTWNQRVDAYVVFTELFRQKFIAAGLPPEKIFLKPHFLLSDPGVKQQQGEYALYAGRLAPEKGIRTLLEAWKLLGNHVPLRIAGDGPNREVLEAVKEQARLSNASFDGWLAPDHLHSVMKRAAFLVFPSEFHETFGLTIIEAFACGVAVIASRLGATMEIVENGKTGLHFTPGNAMDLASKVEWAWTHKTEMEAMGRAARAEYQAKYTAERNYQLLIELYRRARNTTTRKAA
ncbi:MAG TPA: glycosyltransferase family 4 protein [Candidatus Acidoferrum sp.]|jgi:glycosyltransferase involved in cell wall biosynthesis